MIDLTKLKAMRDALQTAIFSGVRRVRFSDGKETEYASMDDMRKAIADLNEEIAAASGPAPSSYSLASYSRD